MSLKINFLALLLFFIYSLLLSMNFLNYYSGTVTNAERQSLGASQLLQTRESLLQPDSIWLNQGKRYQTAVSKLYNKWTLSLWLKLKSEGKLKKVDFPVKDCIGVYYARKGRLKKHWGKSFDEFFLNNWKIHFFLGVRAGGAGFEQKALYLYPRPITYTEFDKQLGKLQWLRIGSTNLGLIVFHDTDHTLLTILDLSKVTRIRLRTWIESQLLKQGVDYKAKKNQSSLVSPRILRDLHSLRGLKSHSQESEFQQLSSSQSVAGKEDTKPAKKPRTSDALIKNSSLNSKPHDSARNEASSGSKPYYSGRNDASSSLKAQDGINKTLLNESTTQDVTTKSLSLGPKSQESASNDSPIKLRSQDTTQDDPSLHSRSPDIPRRNTSIESNPNDDTGKNPSNNSISPGTPEQSESPSTQSNSRGNSANSVPILPDEHNQHIKTQSNSELISNPSKESKSNSRSKHHETGLSPGDWKLSLLCLLLSVLFSLTYSSRYFQTHFFIRLGFIYFLLVLLVLSYGLVWKSKMLDVEKRSIHQEMISRFQTQTKEIERRFSEYLSSKAKLLKDPVQRMIQRKNLRAGSYHIEFRESGETSFTPESIPDYLREIFIRSGPLLLSSTFSDKTQGELKRLFRTSLSNDVLPIRDDEIENIATTLIAHKSGEFYEFNVVSWGFYWYWRLLTIDGESVFFGALSQKEQIIQEFLDKEPFSKDLQVRELWIQRRSRLEESYHWKTHDQETSKELKDVILLGHEELDQGLEFTQVNQQTYILNRVSSQTLSEYSFTYLIPQKIAYQRVESLKNTFAALVVLYIFLAILLFIILFRGMHHFVKELQASIQKEEQEEWQECLKGEYSDERAELIQTYLQMRQELMQRDQLMPFVAHQLLNILKQEDGSYGTEIESRAAVVFCDIRSFTTISENYTPVQIVAMLNEYFELWEEVVQKYGGIIDKFIGDAVEVIFFEKEHQDFEKRAIDCSRDLMKLFANWNDDRERRGELTVQNGIGIAVSVVRFGVIGDEHKKHFLALGEAVELAEELEAKTKQGNKTKIFVQKSIADSLQEDQYQIIRDEEDIFYELV